MSWRRLLLWFPVQFVWHGGSVVFWQVVLIVQESARRNDWRRIIVDQVTCLRNNARRLVPIFDDNRRYWSVRKWVSLKQIRWTASLVTPVVRMHRQPFDPAFAAVVILWQRQPAAHRCTKPIGLHAVAVASRQPGFCVIGSDIARPAARGR